ncbi:uncharacterized protein [Pyxicephalus adspersus]|uniref:uncharacterized protein n=1 Tax=Pyxicephalus adspersus TaxID=30357 RepID=UPI003B5B927D
MACPRQQLLWGAYIIILISCVTGIRYLPEKAIKFTQCSPKSHNCPRNSSCVQTKNGYYCACDMGFYNYKDQMTITYPKGQCIALCPKEGTSSPCVCIPGSIKKKNDEGLFLCIDKCTDDKDCPGNANCRGQKCYCPHGYCNSANLSQCNIHIKLDEECTDKCTNDKDCPGNAKCQDQNCYCPQGQCNSAYLPQCLLQIKLDETCTGKHVTVTNKTYVLPTYLLPFTPSKSTQQPIQSTPSLEISKTTETIQSTTWRTPAVPIPQKTQQEKRICELHYSVELEECEQSMRQDAFCELLKENARIEEQSCQTDTNISVEVPKLC